jgi:hypothetical protein
MCERSKIRRAVDRTDRTSDLGVRRCGAFLPHLCGTRPVLCCGILPTVKQLQEELLQLGEVTTDILKMLSYRASVRLLLPPCRAA